MSTAPSIETANYQPPSWEGILAAHERITPRIHRTPVLTSASLNAMTGAQLCVKCDPLPDRERGGPGDRHAIERKSWRCGGLRGCVAGSSCVDRHAEECVH